MKTFAAVVTASVMLVSLTGCYKSDWEKEKANSAELQKQLDAANESVKKLNTQVQAASDIANKARNSYLATYVDGKEVGRDSISMTEKGFFLKHGPRTRGATQINYANGALVDGPFVLKRDSAPDKLYVAGSVKNNHADGEWVWYSNDGKPANKETYANGKLVSVEAAVIAKDGKLTWKKLEKAAADSFFKARVVVFVNYPELVRENK